MKKPKINQDIVKALRAEIKLGGNQVDAIASILSSGGEFSTAEARKAGIANPSAVISRVRTYFGARIFSNPWSRRSERSVSRGTVNRYRMA